MIRQYSLINLTLNREEIKNTVLNEFNNNIVRFEDSIITLQFNNHASILNIYFKTKTNNKTSFMVQGREKEEGEQVALYLIEKSKGE